MNTRLKIICILFGIAYLFIIGDTIAQTFSFDKQALEEHSASFEAGYQMGKNLRESLNYNQSFWSFKGASLAIVVLSLAVLGLLIYIPIQTYRVIRSMVKDNIFDMINIKRIRKIGYALLATFICGLPIYSLIQYLYSMLLGIEDVSDLGTIRDDYSLLLFGLLVLLFAEILKLSVKMKEENDLTV